MFVDSDRRWEIRISKRNGNGWQNSLGDGTKIALCFLNGYAPMFAFAAIPCCDATAPSPSHEVGASMHMQLRISTAAVWLLVGLQVPGVGNAQTTITFGSLLGAQGSAFTGPYTEGGFTVIRLSSTPNICVETSNGNPTLALAGCSVGSADLSITRVGGGLFTFLGLDLAHGANSSGRRREG